MLCPFVKKSETWFRLIERNALNDATENFMKSERTGCYTSYEMYDCKQEECGAWYDGRCHYADALKVKGCE